ncbi:hypothetical protein BDN70DRAFT_940060 [Pholiota conissans]|uniref:Uncharacterized protein n=1 Tax=Pholiota conissans TaxID=109636 RepID=A0A9P6CKZ9_9AGAR|nr:hypothetical protein BDN70DRAFT_940060 [Pholiota conissans]
MNTNLKMIGFDSWTDCIYPIAGISSTLMVARVTALSESTDSSTVHLTGMQFK